MVRTGDMVELRYVLLQKQMMAHILEEYDIVPNKDDMDLLRISSPLTRKTATKKHTTPSNCPYHQAIRKIISNPNFDRDSFGGKHHELMLCESFYLLWLHSKDKSGTFLDDDQNDEELDRGISATLLLDLYSSNIISFIECGGHNNNGCLVIEIVNPSLAINSIQGFIVNVLLRKRPSRKTMGDVLSLSRSCGFAKCVLKNLRSRGIIGYSERGRLFNASNSRRRQSTINFGPTVNLEHRIRYIALNGEHPDSYMLSLLTVSSCIGYKDDSILDKVIAKSMRKNEYKAARENLKTTVRTQACVRKSSRFFLKKFSRDAHSERLETRKESSSDRVIF